MNDLFFAAAAPAHLPGVLHNLESPLDHYGYLAIAAFVFLEDFGVPVPGETVLLVGAIYAGTGRFSVWLVALIGFLAAILGDNVGFAIGHFGGRPLAERFGKYVLLTPERLDKAAAFFDRHGGKVIVIARFVEGLRQANGIIAGISGMHWRRFLPFNAIGAALWVGVWVSIGYFSGSNIDSIYRAATRYEAWFGIAVGLLILGFIAWHVWKLRAERREKTAARPKSESEVAEKPEAEATAAPEAESTEATATPDSQTAEATGTPGAETTRKPQAQTAEAPKSGRSGFP